MGNQEEEGGGGVLRPPSLSCRLLPPSRCRNLRPPGGRAERRRRERRRGDASFRRNKKPRHGSPPTLKRERRVFILRPFRRIEQTAIFSHPPHILLFSPSPRSYLLSHHSANGKVEQERRKKGTRRPRGRRKEKRHWQEADTQMHDAAFSTAACHRKQEEEGEGALQCM